MGNLKPRETLYLYLFMVGFSFALFALGVWVGKTYYVGAQAEETAQTQSPPPLASKEGEEEEPDLDFYENLVGDSQSESRSSDSGEGSGASQEAPLQPPAQTEAPKAPPPAVEVSPPADDPTLETGYTVQVGAVASLEDAEQLMRELSAKGYKGFIVSPDFSQDSLYRVWVGRYASRTEAERMEGQLKSAQFATYVKRARFPDEN
ncbi:MAG TPA: SPOR domain-containing protein [Acidobacteriota bacterium]|nr:SPOR domain-containing protein [Acidobacteriota bacterium]